MQLTNKPGIFLSFVLMFISLLLLVMLLTYTNLDVSLNSTSYILSSNIIYIFRNYIADFLLQVWGISIYIIPIIVLVYSYHILKHKSLEKLYLKLICIFLLLLLTPPTVYIYFDSYQSGLIGIFIINFLPFISLITWILPIIIILLLFIALGIPIKSYIKTIKLIAFQIIHFKQLFNNITNFLTIINNKISKKKGTIQTTEEVNITPDMEYINNNIEKELPIINATEYAEHQQTLQQNNNFLKQVLEINKKYKNNNTDQINNTEEIDLNKLTIQPEQKSEQLDKSFDFPIKFQNYTIPLKFLTLPNSRTPNISKTEIQTTASKLTNVIEQFGIKGKVVNAIAGPIITLYEISIPPGVKASKLTALETDIALRMSVTSARISIVPGKDVIGIELPNSTKKTIYLKEILQSKAFSKSQQDLPISLGLDTTGNPVIVDLATMPHLLIAGTTGSGKSVGINTIILSLLYKFSPEQCKLIMIDPKMLELSVYQDIPHLITPVVTDPKKAVSALKWAVKEMEHRYTLMSLVGVRNIKSYNEKIKDNNLIQSIEEKHYQKTQEEINFEFIPYIVVIIDEVAELMMTAGKEVDATVQRLAQMARAAGIHVIMATQRPSTDVITGIIKANFPSRICFKVSSSIDSRTIINESGGEQLLGKGDMLCLLGSSLQRIHGPFVSDDEVSYVTDYLKDLGEPTYINDVVSALVNDDLSLDDEDEELVQEAIQIIQQTGKVSVSFLQGKLRIGYQRSSRLMELLEQKGIVSADLGNGKRDIFIK